LKERYNIEFLIQEGFSNKAIALRLYRDKSTLGQEIKRNSNKRKSYSVENAIAFFLSLFGFHLMESSEF